MTEESNQILTKLDSLQEQIAQIDKNLSSKIVNIETNVSSLDTKFSSLNTKFSSLEVKLSSLETTLLAEIGQVKTAVMEMSEDVDAILDMYADQQLKINKLANKIKAG